LEPALRGGYGRSPGRHLLGDGLLVGGFKLCLLLRGRGFLLL
jgi:hypothetical protein